MREFFGLEEDEIVEVNYVGEMPTIDIETNGNHLFFANDVLTHNSSAEEIEFDHQHIAGGISKINTADNVLAIFTTISMKESGRYQIQFLKTRSSAGVGSKVDLKFDPCTLRISDLSDDEHDAVTATTASVLAQLNRSGVKNTTKQDAPPTQTLKKGMQLRDLVKRTSTVTKPPGGDK